MSVQVQCTMLYVQNTWHVCNRPEPLAVSHIPDWGALDKGRNQEPPLPVKHLWLSSQSRAKRVIIASLCGCTGQEADLIKEACCLSPTRLWLMEPGSPKLATLGGRRATRGGWEVRAAAFSEPKAPRMRKLPAWPGGTCSWSQRKWGSDRAAAVPATAAPAEHPEWSPPPTPTSRCVEM